MPSARLLPELTPDDWEQAPEVPGQRYGIQRSVTVDVLVEGVWSTGDAGERRCLFLLRSPGAVMISVQFDRFHLPDGGRVFLQDAARTTFIGGFTQANARKGGLATGVVPGDAALIEYQPPANDPEAPAELRIGSITHGSVDLFHLQGTTGRDIDPGYQSSACQTNVSCPAASGWQQQKRSVALFLRPDGGACTGALVNNTAQNGIPYFLAAKHCYQTNEDQWVFYFNYDSPSCVGNTGPTAQTLTGAVVAASKDAGDLLLMRLNDTPPESYDVYYAGWSRSTAAPTSGAMIHHPLMDVKKINFFSATATSTVPVGSIQCWRTLWTNGVTEGGSSGAPLFDQNKRIVGTVFDGSQTCVNSTTAPTDHAKLNQNWDGTSAETRLRDWLDPSNTVTTLNGFDPVGALPPVLGARVNLRVMLEGAFVPASNNMRSTLREAGLVPLSEPYTALGYVHAAGGGGETTTPAVLSVSGSNAIVDWVVVELRSASDPGIVVASRSALVRSSGFVVDVDGTSTVEFPAVPWGNYHVAVRHRNHFGILSADPHVLGGVVLTRNAINGSWVLTGGSDATKTIGSTRCLLAGDVNRDGTLKYTGNGNDRDPVLVRVGGVVPTASGNGYFAEDVNMDGVVRYTGGSNDRDPILVNIGGTVPTATRSDHIP